MRRKISISKRRWKNHKKCLKPKRDSHYMAFQLFLAKKASLPIMESAFKSYGLIGCRRYSDAVRDIIRVKRQFKQGCSAAVALQLFDQFPISDFCQPLLLCNDTSSMEAYLDRFVPDSSSYL